MYNLFFGGIKKDLQDQLKDYLAKLNFSGNEERKDRPQWGMFFGVKNADKDKKEEATESQKDGETIDHDKDERMKKL